MCRKTAFLGLGNRYKVFLCADRSSLVKILYNSRKHPSYSCLHSTALQSLAVCAKYSYVFIRQIDVLRHTVWSRFQGISFELKKVSFCKNHNVPFLNSALWLPTYIRHASFRRWHWPFNFSFDAWTFKSWRSYEIRASVRNSQKRCCAANAKKNRKSSLKQHFDGKKAHY
jgi:hypothetical protein